MKTWIKSMACAAALMGTTAVQAHGPQAPLHGGLVAQVNDTSYELVAKADSLTIYVADHGKPVDTKGALGKVTLLSAGAKVIIDLAPSGENRLEAKGSFNVAPGAKAVSVVTLMGKPAATARYEIK